MDKLRSYYHLVCGCLSMWVEKIYIIGRLATTKPGWQAGKLKSAAWSTHSHDIRSVIFVTAVFEHA